MRRVCASVTVRGVAAAAGCVCARAAAVSLGALLVVGLVGQPAAAANLIADGACENAIPTLWATTSYQKVAGSLSSAVAADGVRSLKLAVSAPTDTFNYFYIGSVSGLNGFTAGSTYRVSCQAHVPTAGGIAPASAVTLYLYDVRSGQQATSASTTSAALDAWQPLTVTRQIRSGATAAFVAIRVASAVDGQYAYVDDFQLALSSESPDTPQADASVTRWGGLTAPQAQALVLAADPLVHFALLATALRAFFRILWRSFV